MEAELKPQESLLRVRLKRLYHRYIGCFKTVADNSQAWTVRVAALFKALAASALPIGRSGVKTWREVAPDLDINIEVKVGGGLMVAETDAQMKTLRCKDEIERACGIDA